MNRREALCCFLPSFHSTTIPLRSHPHPHRPACPLMLRHFCHLLCARHCALPLHLACQTCCNRLSASLCHAWLVRAFLSSYCRPKRSQCHHIAADAAQLASCQIRTFLQHSTCKKAALRLFALPHTARHILACSLQHHHLLLQVASPHRPHLSLRRHPLLRRRQALPLLGPHKPPTCLTTSLTSSRPMLLV
jgi:hypothetical protein